MFHEKLVDYEGFLGKGSGAEIAGVCLTVKEDGGRMVQMYQDSAGG